MNSLPDCGQSLRHASLETWSRTLDFRNLADTHGTPTYVFSAARLRENVEAYTRLVGQAARILYPVKTNPALAVLRRLARWGCGLDCASRDEVDLGLIAGVPFSRLSYNTPAPEFGLIRNLLRAGGTVVVDSEELLLKVDARVPRPHLQGSLVVRLNLDAGGTYLQHFHWEELVQHGARTSKFGIPAERLIDLLRRVTVPVTGLHVHVGTMMDNLATFETTLTLLHRLVDQVHAQTSHRISLLNLGGGLGIGFLPGQSFPGIDALTERLRPLQRSGIAYFVEPGQSLVGDSMGLLTRIIALKEMRGRKWAIIDVGSDQLMKITTVSWYHQMLDERHRPLPVEGPDAVGGPLCFAGDTIVPATDLGDLREGEVLFLQHAGAYLEALANRFNGRRSASLIVVDDPGVSRATRPEDPFFSPPLQTYDWTELGEPKAPRHELSATEIAALRSGYFAEHVAHDRYVLGRFLQTAERRFEFEVQPTATVDFISVPFAMRIVADVLIVAVLRAMGKVIKDVSVWGSRGSFQYHEPIQPGRLLTGNIILSPQSPLAGGRQKVIATATLDGGRFSMTVEVVV